MEGPLYLCPHNVTYTCVYTQRTKCLCPEWGSNSRPWDYETHALPTAPSRLTVHIWTPNPTADHTLMVGTALHMLLHVPMFHAPFVCTNISSVLHTSVKVANTCFFYRLRVGTKRQDANEAAWRQQRLDSCRRRRRRRQHSERSRGRVYESSH